MTGRSLRTTRRASLWKVDDFASAKLMGYFHQAMLKEGMRPAEALR